MCVVNFTERLKAVKSVYDRDLDLKIRLNSFLVKGFGLPVEDYHSHLDVNQLIQLKSVLSDINNILTLKVSLGFADWLMARFKLSEEEAKMIVYPILETKPSSNGFDMEISEPLKIIAEVKCNIPINGSKTYGSAQKNSIRKDIAALLCGKKKSKASPKDFLKFMVFLDRPEIREATKRLVDSMKEEKSLIAFVDNETNFLDKELVYILFVSL